MKILNELSEDIIIIKILKKYGKNSSSFLGRGIIAYIICYKIIQVNWQLTLIVI